MNQYNFDEMCNLIYLATQMGTIKNDNTNLIKGYEPLTKEQKELLIQLGEYICERANKASLEDICDDGGKKYNHRDDIDHYLLFSQMPSLYAISLAVMPIIKLLRNEDISSMLFWIENLFWGGVFLFPLFLISFGAQHIYAKYFRSKKLGILEIIEFLFFGVVFSALYVTLFSL